MKPRSQFIVSYDITLNKIRTKIEKILKDAGLKRIQYSVFGGFLPEDRLSYMKERLENLKKENTHSILIFMVRNPDNLITVTF